MRFAARRLDFLDEREIEAIVDYALGILDEVGMRIENTRMCETLAEAGVQWNGEFGVRFPRKLIEAHIEAERSHEPLDDRFYCEGGISSYPLRWVDPVDLQVKRQTVRSVIDLTRLCDYLPNIHGIGSVGVPSDVPPLLRPFWMRFIDWRYAGDTLANSYVIWDKQLCPYILEFVEAMIESEPDRGGMERYFRANNYLVSPLRYAREEAEQFMWFHDHGARCTIGDLISIGGTAPVTIAGAIGLGLAETLGISFIMKTFYGDRGLSLYSGPAPLDMRTGVMPYGRPEETLAKVAMTQVVEFLGAPSRGAVGHGTCAKATDFEAGLTVGMGAGLDIALMGKLDVGFVPLSTDEIHDPRLIVIMDEFAEGLKRLARGFEVNAETLPLDVVKEVGPGGTFLSHPHTLEHFREELWLPELFSGESYEAWNTGSRDTILEKARKKVLDILERHHPRGMTDQTEEKLLALIDRFAKDLGITDYKRPEPY
ncbi:MAG TPA: trimethylamine methyltransferase family protein [Planctomycetota bacterium]|nr:trimethylamine methyltransferase family protein [Planctomycetota bacterium]